MESTQSIKTSCSNGFVNLGLLLAATGVGHYLMFLAEGDGFSIRFRRDDNGVFGVPMFSVVSNPTPRAAEDFPGYFLIAVVALHSVLNLLRIVTFLTSYGP